jgi:membrane-associated phospholipid phosphatase
LVDVFGLDRMETAVMSTDGGSWWRLHRPVRLPKPKTPIVLLAVGAIAFVGAALLVHTGATALDTRLFRVINEVPSWAASFLTPLSKLFLPLGLFVVIGAAAVYVTVRNRSALPLLVGAGAAGLAYLLANLAKAAADRPRPYQVIADAVLRQPPAHGTSFPSSHTSVAVATVIALLPFLSRVLTGPVIAYAVLVGWSRIYLGVHFPLDVVGGAGLGMMVGALALLAVRRLASPASTGVPTDP